MKLPYKFGVVSVFAFMLVGFAAANESLDLEHPPEGSHELAEHFHRHHVGVTLGSATRFENHHGTETGMAVGLDYEYRLNHRWGVGGVIEGVTFNNNHRDLAVAFPLSYRPLDSFVVSMGPGFETDGSHRAFMVRLATTYHFEIGKFTLAPEVSLDITSNAQTLVYGFTIGRGF